MKRLGRAVIEQRYGNLFEMYQRITGEDAYVTPMRIFPAIHYTMGGLWVDYHLMSTVRGLFVLGEANFSDHGANRLGASALMQGLADGYFVAPSTVPNYLAGESFAAVTAGDDAFSVASAEVQGRLTRLLSVKGQRTPRQFHRELGHVLWDHVGMARNDAGLRGAVASIRSLREQFWNEVTVPGSPDNLNQSLEYAGRVADYLEFGEILAIDALHRTESCGGHFREESQTPDGEALREDERFSYVAAWASNGLGAVPTLHREALNFDYAHPSQRSYK
jgi:succinate dehydrogenase / fumarate reductase flavoprotein subunit